MNRLAQASQGGERTPGRELGGSRASEGKVSTLSRLWTVVTKKCQDIPDSRSTQRLPKVLCGADSGVQAPSGRPAHGRIEDWPLRGFGIQGLGVRDILGLARSRVWSCLFQVGQPLCTALCTQSFHLSCFIDSSLPP